MSCKQFRAAIVGCGGRGRNHIESLRNSDDVVFTAACEPDRELLKRVGDEYVIPERFETVEEMLNGCEIDLAFVATPAHLNAKAASTLLEASVHTLIEKPPGLNASETRHLKVAADKSGAKCMVGWNRRFHPLIVNARGLIEARGPIVQIVAEFHKSMKRMDNGRWPDYMMDNLLVETPIHALDLCRSLAGSEVAAVHPVVRRVFSKFVDVYAALIVFDNGCVAQFTANYTTDARLERYEIHGKEISAYLEGIKEGTIVCDGDRLTLHSVGGGGGTSQQNQFFIGCIKNDLPIRFPAADLDEAIKTMELADKIREGLAS
ncbi:MAG: Gfo/Idh/MocA family oxidoreductase [Gemmatimonadota bacterium]|nr:Gfo/Idh/MocA family oxidoreductase [Gemmatimonadota bacterium]